MTIEEILDIIPDHIEYPIIERTWDKNGFKIRWSENKRLYKLRMEKTEVGRFVAFYVYTGFEGELQFLPLHDSEFQDILNYGYVLSYVDTSQPTLQEALENLLCWLKEEEDLKENSLRSLSLE